MIDAKQFMNTKFTGTPTLDTKRTPCEPGEFKAVVEEIDLESFPGVKDKTKTYLRMNLAFSVLDEALLKKMGREKIMVYDRSLLDLTAGGDLDFGKERNIRLGQLREATGCNKPGDEWSFPGFKGKIVKVKVFHEMFEGEPQARVRSIATL